jgi:hypothetical protein
MAFVETQENILELVHPGVGKQQGRVVVRHQGAARNDLVSLAMEKIEKRLTDLSSALAHNYPEIKLYTSPFTLPLRGLRSFTSATYLCTIQVTHSPAALTQRE